MSGIENLGNTSLINSLVQLVAPINCLYNALDERERTNLEGTFSKCPPPNVSKCSFHTKLL